MNPNQPDLLAAYKSLEVPTPIISDGTDYEAVEETVEAFFQNVQTALGLGNVTYEELFERTKQIIPSSEAQKQYEVQPDSVEVFKKFSGQVIASVLRISEQPYTQTIRFSKHTLTDETEQAIIDLNNLERWHTV